MSLSIVERKDRKDAPYFDSGEFFAKASDIVKIMDNVVEGEIKSEVFKPYYHVDNVCGCQRHLRSEAGIFRTYADRVLSADGLNILLQLELAEKEVREEQEGMILVTQKHADAYKSKIKKQEEAAEKEHEQWKKKHPGQSRVYILKPSSYKARSVDRPRVVEGFLVDNSKDVALDTARVVGAKIFYDGIDLSKKELRAPEWTVFIERLQSKYDVAVGEIEAYGIKAKKQSDTPWEKPYITVHDVEARKGLFFQTYPINELGWFKEFIKPVYVAGRTLKKAYETETAKKKLEVQRKADGLEKKYA